MTHWYNQERVHQPGSVVLAEWNAQRRAERVSAQGETRLSGITYGTEMYDVLTGGGAVGGAGMPVTDKTAMAVAAVYACVALLGGSLAAIPYHLYKRISPSERERYENDLWFMFNESPWPTWTAAAAWRWAAQSIALRGDSFWRIHRASPYTNAITGLEPLHPDRVYPRRVDGRNVYLVMIEQGVPGQGTVVPVDQDDMLHFSGVGFDGLRSLSPLQGALRSAAGIALAAAEHAGAFFRNGARPDFVLKMPVGTSFDDKKQKDFRENWNARHVGPYNAHIPAILAGGMEVQQLTLSAEDSQLLAQRNFQVLDIARIYGVPPDMIGYIEKTSSWGTGVEQRQIAFRTFTMGRYLDDISQEINRKIWPRSRQYFGEFARDATLDGDSKAQAEYFGKALGGPGTQGWMTINEVRRLKNLPPIEGGDQMIFAGSAPSAAPNTDLENPETNPQPEEPDESEK